MTDQFTGRAVDVDPSEVVKLLTAEIENLPADQIGNVDALTVEYVAAHDQTSSPLGTPRTLRSLAGNSERNRNSGLISISDGLPWIVKTSGRYRTQNGERSPRASLSHGGAL